MMLSTILEMIQDIQLGEANTSSLIIKFVAFGLLAWATFFFSVQPRYYPNFPVISSEAKGTPATTWFMEGYQIVLKGLRACSGPFQVMTGTGPVVVLPNRFAHEVRNNPHLSFNRYFDKDFFVRYPGFEAYRTGYQDGTFIQEVVRTKLTQSLGLVTDDLVDEMTAAAHDLVGQRTDFHQIVLKDMVSNLVARLSSRVFLGKTLARNEQWLQIAKHYTHDSYSAAAELRQWPFFLRPFVYWFLPKCRLLRQAVKDADSLIMPEVEKRKLNVQKAIAAGEKPSRTADTIGWMFEVSRGRDVNYVHGQLFLSFAAIHTTTETITGCLLDISSYPEIVQPLRAEIISVIGENGWAKTSLYKLKLMDSFMKESQRRHFMGITSIHRYADEDIKLSDGSTVKKGSRMMVTADAFIDPKVYPNPDQYDVYRFLNLRSQPGQENAHQFVTTSPQHMLFGHGAHACPGRFFASNEMKIALCHLLLKYDWKLCDGQTERPKNLQVDQGFLTDPTVKVMVKSRKPEIELDTAMTDEP
ncbi:cytochrome P450 [Thelonectria olida]|uniref:Cytochrome P450 n=1 Tax=Thelonectria olida TaxID=1576542 RepID=A0A9P9APG2_9HYPO|nr:cytochrome P450 [Thelonectria olida]